MNLFQNKEKLGWYFYDFANSAFSTLVITVFFGPFLTGLAENYIKANGQISFLGFSIFPDSIFSYSISISVLIQFFILPLIGFLADSFGRRKQIFVYLTFLGVISTSLMFFLDSKSFLLGCMLLISSNFFFGACNVVYNSFLNIISEQKDRDSDSSIGWAFGYIAGFLSMIISLYLYTNSSDLGISQFIAVKLCLLISGIWWGIFSLITFKFIRKDEKVKNLRFVDIINIKENLKILFENLKSARENKALWMFLIAYLIYNDGIQTVITMSALFGSKELGLTQDTLIKIILVVQIFAFIGSLLFNYILKFFSDLNSLIFSLIIWVLNIAYVYFYLKTEQQFYIVAIVFAIVLGGSQALSRGIFSKMIPKEKEGEFFSIYEISDKGTSWLGTLLFGISLQITNSYRFSVATLILFFIFGIILLVSNRKKISHQLSM